jgi:hypothetical protein
MTSTCLSRATRMMAALHRQNPVMMSTQASTMAEGICSRGPKSHGSSPTTAPLTCHVRHCHLPVARFGHPLRQPLGAPQRLSWVGPARAACPPGEQYPKRWQCVVAGSRVAWPRRARQQVHVGGRPPMHSESMIDNVGRPTRGRLLPYRSWHGLGPR